MSLDGYTLSEQAARAAAGHYEKPRPPLKISETTKAKARVSPARPDPLERPAEEIFKPYEPLPGILPGILPVAMDNCLALTGQVNTWAANALFHEGQGFFGYQYLAELIQRAEYRHACDIWAEHAVRKWIKLTGGVVDEKQQDPTAEKRKAIWDELVRLDVRDIIQEWLFHDQAYGRGQIFLDFGDADQTTELESPLLVDEAKINKKRPLKRLTLVEPMWCAPGAYVTNNPLRHDFYRPKKWYVFGRQVDASRFLTITSRPVSDMLKPGYAFGGQSLVQLMKPYVDNWLRTRQAVSDMINIYSILNLKTDMSTALSGADGGAVFDRADMFVLSRDNRGLMLTDKNQEELEAIAVPLSGLHELQAQAQEQLASVSRIPLSIYLQITPTGLNATNDGETRNFYADVHSYQEKNVRGPLKLIIDLIQLSLFDEIDPAIGFEFMPLWEMSDKDKAEIRKVDADADVAYVSQGVVSNEEVRQRLGQDETSLYFGVDLTDPAPDEKDDEPEESPTGGKQLAQDEWSETDHPRDDQGKFSSSGSSARAVSPKASVASLSAFAETKTNWKSTRSGVEYVKNAFPVLLGSAQGKLAEPQAKLEEALSGKHPETIRVENVNPSDLTSLQENVSRNQVLEIAEKGSYNSSENGELPLVIRTKDGLFLVDGNHRANAAALAGGKIQTQVFDYEEWKRKENKPANKEDDDALLKELFG